MCRKGKYKQAFKFSKTPIPNSPNKTRWNAVYMMIYVLLKYKEFYSNIGLQYDELGKLLFFIVCLEIFFTFFVNFVTDLSHCWQFMEEYREAFYPLYLASLISQQEECPISQFHLEWLKAYGQVKALKSNRFRDNILLSMDKRQKTLMEPIAYRAALYMDPRFMYSGSELFKREEKAEIVVSNQCTCSLV